MITYHHIGGRNGTCSLSLNKGPLLKDIHLVLYDADATCLQQMNYLKNNNFSKVNVFPYCIGGENKSGTFHMNFHPTTSSLYKFNKKFSDYTAVYDWRYGLYRFAEAFEPSKSVTIDLMTLQEALQKTGVTEIDFLSLDIQGAEYDVIASSNQILKNKCIGIQLEVEFAQLYEEQKTFSEIDKMLTEMEFELIELDISKFGRASPISVPIGFRGMERPLYAEAVYIKSFDSLKKLKDVGKLYKAALYSLLNNNIGLCIQLLQEISILDNLERQDTQDRAYIKLLKLIWGLFTKDDNCSLPPIGELFTADRFLDFYQYGIDKKTFSLSKDMLEKYANLSHKILELQDKSFSPFENLLNDYGLEQLATVVNEKRRQETACLEKIFTKSK